MNTKVIAWPGLLIVGTLVFPLIVRPRTLKLNDQPAPENPAETSAAEGVSVRAPVPVPAQAGPSARPMMTQAQFFRIRTGMTPAQCVQEIGCKGAGVNPAPGATEANAWYDPDGRNQYTLSFRNGRLMGKSMNMTSAAMAQSHARQRNINAQTTTIDSSEVSRLQQQAERDGRVVSITLDEFQRIQTGMTYDECAAIIGMENPMARGYTAQRNAILGGKGPANSSLDEGYKWINPGGYYAEISFHNGRVASKTWKRGPAG